MLYVILQVHYKERGGKDTENLGDSESDSYIVPLGNVLSCWTILLLLMRIIYVPLSNKKKIRNAVA